MRTVLVYRQTLLPSSETFIKHQAGAVRSFAVRFAGLQPAKPSLPLQSDPLVMCSTKSFVSQVISRIYNISGVAPAFHRLLRSVNPVLVHAHFAPDGASALAIAKALHIPLVVTLHGYDVTVDDNYFARSGSGRQFLRSRNRLFERAAMFVCVSDFIRRSALDKGFPKEKLCTHYIGIDRTHFSPAERRRNHKVLFVGRLVEKKGCIHLLRAMELVSRSLPSAEVLIVGDGPLREDLEAEAMHAGLKCKFLGNQSPSVVEECVAEASLLCIPSVTASTGDSEGLGMVALEAQARGRPVVGFNTGGIREAVLDGQTGLLASPANHVELANHILTLLSDDALWDNFSQRAAQWIAEKFDLRVQTDKLERAYEEVLRTAVA